jgi:hypothetical protein
MYARGCGLNFPLIWRAYCRVGLDLFSLQGSHVFTPRRTHNDLSLLDHSDGCLVGITATTSMGTKGAQRLPFEVS